MRDEPPKSAFENRTFGLMSLGMTLCTAMAVGLVALGARPVWLVVIPLAIFGAVVGATIEFRWPTVPEPKPESEPKPSPPPAAVTASQLECHDCGESFTLDPQRCPMCGGQTTNLVKPSADGSG